MDLQTRSGRKGWFTGEGSLSYSYKSLVATGGIPSPWKMPLVPVGSHRKEEPWSKATRPDQAMLERRGAGRGRCADMVGSCLTIELCLAKAEQVLRARDGEVILS